MLSASIIFTRVVPFSTVEVMLDTWADGHDDADREHDLDRGKAGEELGTQG